MRGDKKVIEQLNVALSSEMTAVVQYMVQAETCESWGYSRLAGLTKARAIEEMHHAEHLIERIVFLDGTPEVAVPLTPKIGKSVQEHLQLDYEEEEGAVKQYNTAARICREAGDAGSKDLFESMITDEERHADFLEAQLHSIKEMGVGAYLAQQMKAGK
jgi:bacterioferritin